METRDTMTGAEMIASERQRQVADEGWTAQHDDTHRDGSLADAAACLAATEPIYVQRLQPSQGYRYSSGPLFTSPWPYEYNDAMGSYHPWRRKPRDADRLGDLVKAGALIAAEIDRLQRANAS